MGTQVQCKSYLGGHKPMKDLNVDCNGNGWHLFYEENNLENRQYYTTFIQRTVLDAHAGHDKNGLKRKMLEHDAIFKNQVYELHRLYRTQRDLMEDIKTKEGHRHGVSIEPSSSSSLQGPQAENGGKWHISSHPITSSVKSSELGTENMTSPLSCSKGNGMLSSQVQLQNECSKDYKVSEARPMKVRKKLIDLQLPADECSDTEVSEKLDTKTFDCSSFTPNQVCNGRLESSVKLSNGDFVKEKMDILQEEYNSASSTRISIGLVDLNEPVEVEEATESSSIKIFGQFARNGADKAIDLPAKHNSGFLDLPNDAMFKPRHGRNDSLNNFLIENNANGRKWLPFAYEAGTQPGLLRSEHAGRSCNLVSRSVRQDKLSLRATPSKLLSQDHHPGVHFADHSQETPGKERMAWGVEEFHRSQDYANHTHRETTEDSQLSNSNLFLGSSGISHTRPHIISPWVKPKDRLSPKFTPLLSQNSSRGLNKTLQSSALSNDVLGEKWYTNNSSLSNPGLTRDTPSCNGFYHVSSSGSKDSPVFGCDHSNCSRGDKIACSLQVKHGMEKAYMVSRCTDTKRLKDLNLNESFWGNALNEAVPCQDLGIMNGKSKLENHKTFLPWLRANPAFNSEAANPERDVISISSSPPRASQGSLFGKSETGKGVISKGVISQGKTLLPWFEAKPAFNSEKAAFPERDVIYISSSPPRASQGSLFGKRETGKQMISKVVNSKDKTSLPWFQAKPAFNSEAAYLERDVISISSSPPRASQGSLVGKRETGKDLKDMYNATSSTYLRTCPKNERYETQCVDRILGGTIFEKLAASENEASSLASSTTERENIQQEKKNLLIDINVACDASHFESGDRSDVEEVVIEKPIDKSSSVSYLIDLNSYVTEDEDPPIPYGAGSNLAMKFVADFDLEAPAVPEEEDILPEKEKVKNILPQLPHCESEELDDVLISAAEAIVGISSCRDKTQEKSIISLSGSVELESLLWFADVVSTADKLENSSCKECSYKEIDDFEAMTLLLPDTKEDYLPKLFIPEVQDEEVGGSAPPTRPRRGQARRGRQRRDFQRDILPGLATLSRHEMTEDLQTFGGLMRATGHAWNLGSTRRNGGTRGRRRKAVELAHDSAPVGGCTQDMNNEENSLEDRRSLTGWGKTTRRPRRQRCPASNAPTVALP